VTPLEQALEDYLRLRRGLGHELEDARRLLPHFVAYLEAEHARTVTVQNALTWAQQSTGRGGYSVAPRRLSAVRGFARYLSGIDPLTEVPPLGLIPAGKRWRAPFLFTSNDVEALITAADRVIVSPLRVATYQTLIGLLAATGLRIGEAINLDRSDVDWSDGVLLIRESKFGKSRLVPLHPSAVTALRAYAQVRDVLTHARWSRASSSHSRASGCSTPSSSTRSASSSTPRESVSGPRHRPGCTTCATASRSTPCSAGITSVRTSRSSCRCSRPTSGTASRRTPTGTCPRHRSCSPSPPHASPGVPGRGHDAHRADPPGVLHRSAHPATPGQPAHHRRLPRRVETAAAVRAPAHRQGGVRPGGLFTGLNIELTR
jgi:integrase